MRRTEQMDANYNFPVIALKALTEYQPRDYLFALADRTLFDIAKLPKSIKILSTGTSARMSQSHRRRPSSTSFSRRRRTRSIT